MTKVFYHKKVSGKKVKMSNIEEIFDFLALHGIRLTVDLFTFNPNTNCQTTVDKKRWWDKCMVEVRGIFDIGCNFPEYQVDMATSLKLLEAI